MSNKVFRFRLIGPFLPSRRACLLSLDGLPNIILRVQGENNEERSKADGWLRIDVEADRVNEDVARGAIAHALSITSENIQIITDWQPIGFVESGDSILASGDNFLVWFSFREDQPETREIEPPQKMKQ